MIDELKLLPCAFCGGEPEIRRQGNDYSKRRKVVIKCKKCRVERTDAALRNGMGWLEKIAIQQWNSRTDSNSSTSVNSQEIDKSEDDTRLRKEVFAPKGTYIEQEDGVYKVLSQAAVIAAVEALDRIDCCPDGIIGADQGSLVFLEEVIAKLREVLGG